MTNGRDIIWADLLHVSCNMWGEGSNDPWVRPEDAANARCKDHLQVDDACYRKITEAARAKGLNMIVLDLGDAVVWPSLPEIAVKGAWTPERLRDEVARLRRMGLEPVPKLNFSTGHDSWLKEYSRMVSTPTYYRVCAGLIRDVFDIFGPGTRFMHLGFDEEMYAAQEKFAFVCMRQGELWWHDLLFFVREVERHGARAWIWSDKCWHDRREFIRRMPRTVVQSSWYYFPNYKPENLEWNDEIIAKRAWLQEWCSLPAFVYMGEHGYDQIPCGSNVYFKGTFEPLVKFCRDRIPPERLLGFLMAPWGRIMPGKMESEMAALDETAAGMAAFAG